MRFLGNLIWLLCGGLIFAVLNLLVGIVLCLTIVFIPFGLQFFKFSRLTLMPFGQHVDADVSRHLILNVIWLALGGAMNAIGCFFVGLIFCITIILIPFGIQFFKLMRLSVAPFGAKLYR